MIHSERGFAPRIFPEGGSGVSLQINRAQSLAPTASPTYVEIKELGRDGKVKSIRQSVEVTNRLTQYEEGELDLYRALANKPDANKLELTDFASSLFGIGAYLKNDKGEFKGSVWYPGQRLGGFTIEIGDPRSMVTRTFDFSGEDVKVLQSNNKYLIELKKVVESGETPTTEITIGAGDYANYPEPSEDPNNSGTYILRVVRTRGSDVIVLTSGYSYDPDTKKITINNTEVGDIYKIYYSASSYISGENYWTDNDSIAPAIPAYQCSLYIATSNYLHRIESARIEVAFTREDHYEIGAEEAFARGVSSYRVTLTLGKILDKFTLEELLSGKSAGWGIITPKIFSNDITFYLLIYSDLNKSNFKLGYKITKLALTSWTPGDASVEAYLRGGVTLESDNLLIANNLSDLGL